MLALRSSTVRMYRCPHRLWRKKGLYLSLPLVKDGMWEIVNANRASDLLGHGQQKIMGNVSVTPDSERVH